MSSDTPGLPPSDGGGSESSEAGAQADASRGAGYSWDASACGPGDVQTFQPGAYVPASAPQDVCGPGTIEDLYTYCLGPYASVGSCSTFQTLNQDCFDSVLTQSTASSCGPIIDYQGFVEANIAGCVELTSHGELASAKSVQALTGCQLAACQANCPVRNASSLADLEGCTTDAETGGCQAYATAASCFTADDSGPLSVCMVTDFYLFYEAVAPLFCAAAAPAMPDAGVAPAAVDASRD